ncbi:pyridoxamine 5'-phosphate oxidase family protein [bacterium]|nr:pyridoxamine 5'-phosphate oxidase family protein [bacterium]
MKYFKQIKNIVKNSLYCSVSTITAKGHPHISPIGSVYLIDETRGYFIEMFTTSPTKRHKEQDKACIMAINTSLWFWFKSLFLGRFPTIPGVRLLVDLKEKRPATEKERERFLKKVRPFRFLKGHKILWSSTGQIREFTIDQIIPLKMSKMTSHFDFSSFQET